MTIAYKTILKKIATEPAEITTKDIEEFSTKLALFVSELIHTILMVNAGRTEAILTHLAFQVDTILREE